MSEAETLCPGCGSAPCGGDNLQIHLESAAAEIRRRLAAGGPPPLGAALRKALLARRRELVDRLAAGVDAGMMFDLRSLQGARYNNTSFRRTYDGKRNERERPRPN